MTVTNHKRKCKFISNHRRWSLGLQVFPSSSYWHVLGLMVCYEATSDLRFTGLFNDLFSLGWYHGFRMLLELIRCKSLSTDFDIALWNLLVLLLVTLLHRRVLIIIIIIIIIILCNRGLNLWTFCLVDGVPK